MFSPVAATDATVVSGFLLPCGSCRNLSNCRTRTASLFKTGFFTNRTAVYGEEKPAFSYPIPFCAPCAVPPLCLWRSPREAARCPALFSIPESIRLGIAHSERSCTCHMIAAFTPLPVSYPRAPRRLINPLQAAAVLSSS